MKRFRLWIKELSLTQQLIAIIFIITVSLALFFFVFLNNSVDTFVETEMYKSLHRSQNNMNFYLENGFAEYDQIADSNIYHIVFYEKSPETGYLINTTSVDDELIKDINKHLDEATDIPSDFVYENKNHNNILYSIVRLNNDEGVLASVMSNSYKLEFRNAIVNTFINVNMMVIFFSFTALMLWVSGLIHPLNQIRNYINYIKNDEKATLNINRKDEIGDVANALIEMKEQLDKENLIKEEMIQNISHDLKTPIATIKSYSESIKDGIYPYDTLEKSVDVIIENANRLEKKVYQLIVLNKMGYLVDNGEVGQNLNMKSVIEKVIISLKVVKPEIELRINLKETYFHGDEEPWRIVVENLIDNSLRYAKSYVEISLADDELTVINDGKAIEKDRLDKLFKPYEKGTDGKFGLGLSIVQRVTSTYGYRVSAENLTNGVCFRIVSLTKRAKIKDMDVIGEATIKQIPSKKKSKAEKAKK
ncbi:MAG: HAMP domain-containing histidine kinase [Erysipelotrichaceae bacterium]|nr:HAMP domain-containing histidine kinase [Erysipelotrichaceae bacterium]MDY5252055.1 HAMP domain-containing sensor histidine kinase [Erysipelotrichaceae bacterium]